MTAPAGTEVGLYVDLVERVELGHVIQTQTGRRYLVTAVRVQQRGKHVGRQHLRCVVLAAEAQLGATKLHRIRWYARGRGRW